MNKLPQNNFDFVRLMAALFVIIGHSVFILGLNETEYFGQILGLHAIHGSAVHIFFTLSGYLIAKSYIKNPSIKHFLRNRCLRIFPALIFSTFITFFMICPFFSSVSYGGYFMSGNSKYLLNIFLFFDHYTMVHVFDSANDVNYVNRSLWTLKYEFSLYILVLILGVFGLLKSIIFPFLFALLTVIMFYKLSIKDCPEYFKFLYVFSMGIMFYWLEQRIHLNTKKVFICLCCIYILGRIILPPSELRFNLLELILPLITLCFSLQNFKYIHKTARFGDFSYGIYLFGYPIQQALYVTLSNTAIVKHLYVFSGLSILVTFCFAFISWHLVEKRFLRWKHSSS
jgi:peptidoglycan/LPS O-acetylase OafA/YrhL